MQKNLILAFLILSPFFTTEYCAGKTPRSNTAEKTSATIIDANEATSQEEDDEFSNDTFKAAILKNNLENLLALNPDSAIGKEAAKMDLEDDFTTEELYTIATEALKKAVREKNLKNTKELAALRSFLKKITKELQEYHVKGFGFGHHFGAAFFYSYSKIPFSLNFKNPQYPELITRNFLLSYDSIGLQSYLNYDFNLIFLLGSDSNLASTINPLKIKTGISLYVSAIVPHVGISIIPLADKKSTILIIHFGLGFNSIVDIGINYSGTLTRTDV